jgi:hypothetical protein
MSVGRGTLARWRHGVEPDETLYATALTAPTRRCTGPSMDSGRGRVTKQDNDRRMNPMIATEFGKTLSSSLNPIDDFVFLHVDAVVTGKNGKTVRTTARLHRVRAGEHAGKTAFIEVDPDAVTPVWPMHSIAYSMEYYVLTPDATIGNIMEYWKPGDFNERAKTTLTVYGNPDELEAKIEEQRARLIAKGIPDNKITIVRENGRASISS